VRRKKKTAVVAVVSHVQVHVMVIALAIAMMDAGQHVLAHAYIINVKNRMRDANSIWHSLI
jgi:hypothetical protein